MLTTIKAFCIFDRCIIAACGLIMLLMLFVSLPLFVGLLFLFVRYDTIEREEKEVINMERWKVLLLVLLLICCFLLTMCIEIPY